MHRMVIYPAVDSHRLERIVETAGDRCQIINATTLSQAVVAMEEATAFFGKITPELLSHARNLRWVQTATASLEHYLFPELVSHSCSLTNMRGLFSDVIADHVMGFVLCFARNLHRYIRLQSQCRWEPIGGETQRSDFIFGNGVVNDIDRAHQHLSDCTLGVVGVGHIGREILKRAQAFGMRLLGVDVRPSPIPEILEEVWNLERLPQLLAESDYVVIAAPHTPQTFKMFRLPQLQQMRSNAVLINIGRGAIVDLQDLTRALERGLIGGAALDVFEIEPLPTDHPLWRMENVILTPHIAAASTHIADRHLETLLENLNRFLEGRPFLTLADKTQWF